MLNLSSNEFVGEGWSPHISKMWDEIESVDPSNEVSIYNVYFDGDELNWTVDSDNSDLKVEIEKILSRYKILLSSICEACGELKIQSEVRIGHLITLCDKCILTDEIESMTYSEERISDDV